MLHFVGDHFQQNDRYHRYDDNCLLCHCEVLYFHSTTRLSEMYHFAGDQRNEGRGGFVFVICINSLYATKRSRNLSVDTRRLYPVSE